MACAHVRGNRDFLVRAVRHLADEGVRQFLDIGTGVPNDTNTLALAQAAAPEAAWCASTTTRWCWPTPTS